MMKASLLNFTIAALVILAAIIFVSLIVIVVMRLAGTLTDTLYIEIRTFSGKYRNPTFAEMVVFLIVIGLALVGMAKFLTRYQ